MVVWPKSRVPLNREKGMSDSGVVRSRRLPRTIGPVASSSLRRIAFPAFAHRAWAACLAIRCLSSGVNTLALARPPLVAPSFERLRPASLASLVLSDIYPPCVVDQAYHYLPEQASDHRVMANAWLGLDGARGSSHS